MTSPIIRRFVATGDSLSEGYSNWGREDRSIGFVSILANRLRTVSPDLQLTNLGISGARTADVLRNQLPRAIALKPDLLTLVVGANDVPGTQPELFRRDYDDLIGRLRAGVPGLVAVGNIPDFAHLLPAQYVSYRVALGERVQMFNRIIAEAALAHGVLLVDLHGSREAEDPRNLSGDGVHPNARGYRIMARVFVETLNRAGFDLELLELDSPDA